MKKIKVVEKKLDLLRKLALARKEGGDEPGALEALKQSELCEKKLNLLNGHVLFVSMKMSLIFEIAADRQVVDAVDK